MAQKKRGKLNPRIPTTALNQSLADAAALARRAGQRLLTPEALLLTLVRDERGPVYRILQGFGQERGFDMADLATETERLTRTHAGRDGGMDFENEHGDRIPLSQESLQVLDDALTIAHALDELQIAPEHALAAMSQKGVSTAGILQSHGVTPSAMSQVLQNTALQRETMTRDLVALAREGESTPVYYRESLLREFINLLSMVQDRHVILIGPAGVGKRSLAISLAHLIVEGNGPPDLDKLVQLSEAALIDAPDRAIRAGLRQARGGILLLPDLHRFFERTVRTDLLKAAREIRQAFLNPDPIIVGSATEREYDETLATEGAINGHSHTLRVPPTDVDETLSILKVHASQLENEYDLQIDLDSLQTVATMAQRYLNDAPLPESALHLLHRTCALVRTGAQELSFGPGAAPDKRLDAQDVLLAVNMMTGIPVDKLGADQRARYARMVEHIHQRIIGQDEAVLAVSRAIKTARVGLKDPKRPIGSFLFLGPTGVGKTELAKALAEFLFGNEDASVELDMSEYQNESSVNRLIGAPPGYVGYEGGGQLTDAVREQPYTVVLFDEVEKAHQRVMDVLLQVMEEGRLTDGQGRTVSFSETVIILTSNLGSEYLVEPVTSEAARELVMDEVKRHFRPEFLNRLDEIILFHPLSPEQLRLILSLMLDKEQKLLKPRQLALNVSEAARTWLLAQNEHPEWGARPLRRIIRKWVREPLADYLLKSDPPPGIVVQLDVKQGKLALSSTAGDVPDETVT
jgi:ATP-dependent Clp protease ATP-binding subunit ClpC